MDDKTLMNTPRIAQWAMRISDVLVALSPRLHKHRLCLTTPHQRSS